MPTLRALVDEASTLDGAAAAIHAEMEVDRLSIATFDHDGGAFEIVTSSGKPLFHPGLQVPVDTSTQMRQSAAGVVYRSGEFRDDAEWGGPVDALMLGLGFSSGCSLPLGPAHRPIGAVSLSSTTHGVDYDGRVKVLTEVQDVLTSLLEACGRVTADAALICHDDEVVGEGLARLLEREIGLRSFSCTGLAEAKAILDAHHIAIIVCDDYLGGVSFDTVAAALRAAGSTAPVGVVASHETAHNQLAAASGGAADYVSRAAGGVRILGTIVAVTAGRSVPREDRPSSQLTLEHLTRRERDVLLDLDDGLRFKQIAVRRGISPATANGYAKSLFRKLGVHSRSEAVTEARRNGLLDSVRRHDRGMDA